MLACEPFILLLILIVFWTPDLRRVETLPLMLPVLAARVILYRRLIPQSPFNGLMIALLGLMILNLSIAPFRWDTWILGRPVLGVLLATSFADRARRNGRNALDGLMTASAILGLIIGVGALFWSQWTVKSAIFEGIFSVLPNRPMIEPFSSYLGGGFNVNEIAGAMAWLCPLTAALAIHDWKNGRKLRRWLSLAAFTVLAVALMLGQSRFAIFGVLPALVLIALVMLRRGWGQTIALIALAGVLVFELLLLTGAIHPVAEVALVRDESSVSSRLMIWEAGLEIIRDYPLTGVGLNQYRTRTVRDLYPVPGYETSVLPHAHNEWIQIGSDLGIPGIIVFTALYGVAFWTLVQSWRQGQSLAVGIGAGLAAHAVYGLGDAITLFDRFAFVFWWMIGLAAAARVISTLEQFTSSEPDVK